MDKPKKRSFAPVYYYNDIINYIQHKYNIRTRGYKREVDGKYKDFWHWILDKSGSINNGCFIYLPSIEEVEEEEWWQKEILQLIVNEFGDNLKVWVEW